VYTVMSIMAVPGASSASLGSAVQVPSCVAPNATLHTWQSFGTPPPHA
jgi:hypothetical protein